MKSHVAVTAALALCFAPRASSAPPALLAPQTFEVVSIKPNKSGDPTGNVAVQPGGRYSWINTTLKSLIQVSYQRRAFDMRDVLDGPSWIDSDRFDLIAKAQTPPADIGEVFAMVRSALKERFKLEVHEEVRERPIYKLVLARSDGQLRPKLRRSTVDCAAVARDEVQGKRPPDTPSRMRPCAIFSPPGRLIGVGLTIDALANVLQGPAGRPVVDKTGLTGAFDWEIEFAPDFQAAPVDRPDVSDSAAGDRPSIFTALQEQLGLKLESTQGPVDVLVVDRAEQPTPD